MWNPLSAESQKLSKNITWEHSELIASRNGALWLQRFLVDFGVQWYNVYDEKSTFLLNRQRSLEVINYEPLSSNLPSSILLVFCFCPVDAFVLCISRYADRYWGNIWR